MAEPTPDRVAYLRGYFTAMIEADLYAHDSKLAADIRQHGKKKGIEIAAQESADLAAQMAEVTEFFNAEAARS